MLLSLVLPLLFALVLPWTAQAQQWSTYRPDGAGYSIDLPGKPTVESETTPSPGGPITSHSAEVDTGQAGFVSMYTVYPSGLTMEANTSLDAARDGMLEDGKSELRDEKKLMVSDAPARRVTLFDKESKVMIVNLMVFRHNTLYQSIYAAPSGQEDTETSRRFFDSFKLLDR